MTIAMHSTATSIMMMRVPSAATITAARATRPVACHCGRRRLAVSAPLWREVNANPKKNAKQCKQRHGDPFGFSKLTGSSPSRHKHPPPHHQQHHPPAPPPRPFPLTNLALLRSTDIASGDLVLIVRKGQPQLGAVIDHAGGLKSLLGTGFHLTHGPSEVWFRVPQVYSLASGNDKHAFVQADVRAISRRAQQLRLDLADQFAAAYKHFTSVTPERETVPLADYLAQVFGPDTPLTVDQVLAAVLHLISDPARYLTSFFTLHQRATVQFRPLRSLNTLTQGQRLIADAAVSEEAFNKSSLASFLVKCRALLDYNNAAAATSPPLSPHAAASSTLDNTHTAQSSTSSPQPPAPSPPAMDWTPDDLTLLACLREVALGPRASLSAFAFVGTHVLGPLGYKPDVRFPGPTLLLLLDLGVYHRLDNFPLYTQAYALQPLEGLGFARADTQAERALAASQEVREAIDGLDGLRRVFGKEVEVYTVDDPGAHEIDDGVSVELDAATGDVSWVHVHVADPTAFIPRDSLLAKFALQRGQTVYFPEATFPMLPGTIGSGLLSLASSTSSADPVRALTVSFRVNAEGDVVDARVEPSEVHTVIPRAYDLVDTVLEFKDMPGVALPSAAAAQVAPARVLRSNPSLDALVAECKQLGPGGPVTPQQAKAFQALQGVAKRHAKLRHERGGAFNPASSAAMVSAVVQGGLPALTPLETAVPQPRPPVRAVDIKLHRDLLPLSPARQMIAELMIMAGRAAAMVAGDAKVPVPFRYQPAPDLSHAYLPWAGAAGAAGAVPHPFASQVHPTSYTLNLRDTLTSLSLMLPADQGTSPGPHYQMGLSATPGYVKITSPLRRAVDLLGHWQLKHAFARGRGAAADPGMLSADQLTQAMAAMRERERVIKSVQRAREAWWALEALRLRQVANPDLMYAARVLRVMDRPAMALGVPPGSVGVGALVQLVDAGVKAIVWMPGAAGTTTVEVGEWVSVWIKQVCPIDGQVTGEVVKRWVEVDPTAD